MTTGKLLFSVLIYFSFAQPIEMPKKMVWHCGDPVLANTSIQFMEQYDLGKAFGHMKDFLETYRDGGWTLINLTYARSLAYTVDKGIESDSILARTENPNLCYISRLDTSVLMFMVRVYADK